MTLVAALDPQSISPAQDPQMEPVRHSLEGVLCGDSVALIKPAGLRNDFSAANAAIEIVGVKSDAHSQRFCPRQGLRITPGALRQTTHVANEFRRAREIPY